MLRGGVGALLDCDFLLPAPTFQVGGGIGGLLELLLVNVREKSKGQFCPYKHIRT
jgi:hypothetical protein